MKETDELEQQQYARLYWEADVPLRDMSTRLLRRLLLIASAIFAAMIATAYWVKFPDQIELPFVLKNEEQEEVYKFPFPVYLLEQYVQTGTAVKPDDRLLRITSPEIVALLGQYRANLLDSTNLTGPKQNSLNIQRDILRSRLMENRAAIEADTRQLDLVRQTWIAHETELRAKLQDATDKAMAYNRLYETGNIVSRFDMSDKESLRKEVENKLQQEKLRFEKESLRLQTSIEQAQIDDNRIKSELAKIEADYQVTNAEITGSLQLARRQINDLFGNCDLAEGSVVLKSGIAGSVSFLFEGEKQIGSGATLLKINKGDPSVFAFLKCTPDKIGKLRQGMSCHLKVSTFPFYEYGSAKAHVNMISHTPDEEGLYNLYLALDDPGQLKGLLQPGMNGTAVLIIEEKTLLQFFFRELKRQYHHAMG